MRTIRWLCLFLAATTWAQCSAAHAEDVYTLVIKKQEEKAKARWTLAEWLETRDRNRLMDLWLAMHSPSPYEFFVGADFLRPSGFSINGAAYASIFGLGVERIFSPEPETSGEFLLRVFGYHVQATNITLHAGVRYREARNNYAGVNLTVYLAKYFGLEGLYRRHWAPAPSVTLEGGGFIDFGFLRVFAAAGSESPDGQSGISRTTLGTRLFF